MSAWRERVEIAGGRAVLYLGDNREVWPALGVRPDALISDPPYGQNVNTAVVKSGKRGGVVKGKSNIWSPVFGDDNPFDPAPWLQAADNVLLWGAHKFHSRLPETGRWLFWDKRVDVLPEWDQGCGEMAWHSRPGAVRIARIMWGGLVCAAGTKADHPRKFHPTEKPIALMAWCLEQAKVEAGALVADPFLGAGSTGVACMRRGCRFIGIEIDEGYFRTACRRIEAAARQPDLLIPETAA